MISYSSLYCNTGHHSQSFQQSTLFTYSFHFTGFRCTGTTTHTSPFIAYTLPKSLISQGLIVPLLQHNKAELFYNMLNFNKVLLLATWLTSVISSPIQPERRATGSLDSWLASESPTAQQGVLDNIGTQGVKVPGAAAGVVVASPSKVNPNCKPARSSSARLPFLICFHSQTTIHGHEIPH